MDIDKTAAKRSRTHTRYVMKDGTMVPGVTTILGVLNKPALVPWANKLGLAGIDVSKYVDTLAAIGSIAHEMVLCHNHNKAFEANGHPADLIDKAENALLKYFEWEKGHEIEPILCETALVSELLGYGGTMDMYCKLDGVRTLLDYKTGKAIYPEHIYQASAYRILLREHGYEVEKVKILQIGRSEDEDFSEKTVTDTVREERIFRHCLELYKLKVGR